MKKIPKQTYFHRWDKKDLNTSRVVKSLVHEVLSLVKQRIKKPLSQIKVLDVGSGNGDYAVEISKFVKKVVGVEPFERAYNESLEKSKRAKNIEFYNTLIENFKTKEKFDLVLCLTVIEHMPNAKKSFKKIFSLMNKGAILYLTAPNKLWPYEQHYKLPFLSWLPLPLANAYIKVTKRGKDYADSAYSRTYPGMKRFFEKFPCKFEFLVPKLNFGYLGCANRNDVYNLILNLGVRLIKFNPFFWSFSKGFILVITKK